MVRDPLAAPRRKGTPNFNVRCPADIKDAAQAVAAGRPGEDLTWLVVGTLKAYAADPARVAALLNLPDRQPPADYAPLPDAGPDWHEHRSPSGDLRHTHSGGRLPHDDPRAEYEEAGDE